MAPTTLRNVRVDEDLWTAAQTRAETENTTVSDVIRAALEDYVCHLLCSCGHHSYDHDGDPSGTVGESCGLCKCSDFTPAWATR